MENFAFGSSAHHKGFVPESADFVSEDWSEYISLISRF